MAGNRLKVNTDQVVSTANKIKNINDKINKEFEAVEKAIRTLDNYWESPAASTAIEKFSSIKDSFYDARYAAVNNYVNFLLTQVGEGYVQTEDKNKSLADAFK